MRAYNYFVLMWKRPINSMPVNSEVNKFSKFTSLFLVKFVLSLQECLLRTVQLHGHSKVSSSDAATSPMQHHPTPVTGAGPSWWCSEICLQLPELPLLQWGRCLQHCSWKLCGQDYMNRYQKTPLKATETEGIPSWASTSNTNSQVSNATVY